MKTYRKHIIATLVATILLSTSMWGGAIADEGTDISNDDLLQVSPDTLLAETNPFDRFYLDAVCQRAAGNDSAASALLDKALAINPNAAEAYYLRSEIYADAGKSDSAFECMCRAAQLQPANATYQESVADTYIRRGEMDKAVAAYEDFYKHHRDRSDILRTLVAIFMYQKNYNNALSTLDRMEIVDGQSDDLTSLRLQIYNSKGDDKGFYNTLSSIIESHPYDASYKAMLGNWLVSHKRKGEAYKFFKAAAEQAPDDAFVQTSLLDYYKSVDDTASFRQLRENILLSQKTDPDVRAKTLSTSILDARQAGVDSTEVLRLINHTMQAAPKDVNISNLKAVYMKLIGMPSDSVEAAYRHSLDIAPDNIEARVYLIQNNWDDKDRMEKLASEGTQYNPDDVVFYYFLGLACYQSDKFDRTIEAMRKGVSLAGVKSNGDVVSDMYCIMGEALYRKQLYDEAFAAFDSCLQWKDDNYSCLNNYAYYISSRGGDLKKAERMSYKTIDAEPSNATYLDTYAWILYLEKRYDDAKVYIDRAVENDSVPSDVVLEHAGDIHCKAGDTDGAVELWQRAIDCGGNKAVLTRKIKSRKVE